MAVLYVKKEAAGKNQVGKRVLANGTSAESIDVIRENRYAWRYSSEKPSVSTHWRSRDQAIIPSRLLCSSGCKILVDDKLLG
jgi:hypothetical protein